MRISHRHKFVFFSSPKTGSESIRSLLDPLSDVRDVQVSKLTPAHPFHAHMRPLEARMAFMRLGWRYTDYYSFVFVRNPWTRLVSLYQYALKAGAELPGFEDWLQATQPNGIGGGLRALPWLKYGTYSIDAFAGDGNGNLLVSDVFRLEDIAEVPDRLRLRGIPLPADAAVPWVNRTKESASLDAYYTPELRKLVADRYAKEIERFAYSYPG
jgi:hypothetical protein